MAKKLSPEALALFKKFKPLIKELVQLKNQISALYPETQKLSEVENARLADKLEKYAKVAGFTEDDLNETPF